MDSLGLPGSSGQRKTPMPSVHSRRQGAEASAPRPHHVSGHGGETGAELLFRIITPPKERTSIVCTSNAPLSEWGNTFTDPRLAAAVVDRLTFTAR